MSDWLSKAEQGETRWYSVSESTLFTPAQLISDFNQMHQAAVLTLMSSSEENRSAIDFYLDWSALQLKTYRSLEILVMKFCTFKKKN